ncbi:MAG: zf-HC2 domain-containing protein [Anaerolineae bacterium]|nr:zf-HC2 domain-containing protein [Anaerolineae bacterium]
MKCSHVQSLLVSYLNNETTPSERSLIQTHLSGCSACQKELALLSKMQGQVNSALLRRAAHATPRADAWERLEARLAGAAQPSPTRSSLRESRLAPGVKRSILNLFSGGITMKRLVMAGGGAVLTIALVILSVFNGAPKVVTAHDILDQAYQAQIQATPESGISHYRYESYHNYEALPEDQVKRNITDSYIDLENQNVRLVVTDSETGKVIDAFSSDDTYAYNARGEFNGDALIVYRTPRKPQSVVVNGSGDSGREPDYQSEFDRMRSDPNTQFLGEESWDNGHMVYVLRSQQPAKAIVNGTYEVLSGTVTMYFDSATYNTMGTRVTIEKDGQEILIELYRVLANETLPAGSAVAWDLSDLQGITIVDDPEGARENLPPEVMSAAELGDRMPSAYLLESAPDGYTLQILTHAAPSPDEPFTYVASYNAAGNVYFTVRSMGATESEPMNEGTADEVYTTANGLELRFINTGSESKGYQYTLATCTTPAGVELVIESNLSRETAKVWAEELAPVK